MHNLAIALHRKGYQVTGSDDEIFEPSKSRLANEGILPPQWGWYPEKLDKTYDAVILGMHARIDNPELVRAQELGLKVYSYPEYLYEQSKDKTRIVVGGSHGKTTITSMILHVLKQVGIETDFMVGAQLEGFDVMVRLSETAKYMVPLSSPYRRHQRHRLGPCQCLPDLRQLLGAVPHFRPHHRAGRLPHLRPDRCGSREDCPRRAVPHLWLWRASF